MRKATIASLLKQGDISGEAVGRLFLKHYLVKQNTDAELFDDTEKRRMIRNLRDNFSIRQYNGYVNLTSMACDCIVSSKMQSLSASKRILVAVALVNMTRMSRATDLVNKLTPTIMTKGEYDKKAEAYKNEHLEDEISLEEAIIYRLWYYIRRPSKIKRLWKKYQSESDAISRRNLSEYEDIQTNADVLLSDVYGEHESYDFDIETLKEDFPELYERITGDLQQADTGFPGTSDVSTTITAEEASAIFTTRKRLISAGMIEHKQGLSLDEEHPQGIAILRQPSERHLDDSGAYRSILAQINWEPALGAEEMMALHQVIRDELYQFANLKALAYGIASLVEITRIKLIDEDEEEIRCNLALLKAVALSARGVTQETTAAFGELGALEIVRCEIAAENVSAYLRRITPSQYSDLSKEEMMIEKNWVLEAVEQEKRPGVCAGGEVDG